MKEKGTIDASLITGGTISTDALRVTEDGIFYLEGMTDEEIASQRMQRNFLKEWQ